MEWNWFRSLFVINKHICHRIKRLYCRKSLYLASSPNNWRRNQNWNKFIKKLNNFSFSKTIITNVNNIWKRGVSIGGFSIEPENWIWYLFLKFFDVEADVDSSDSRIPGGPQGTSKSKINRVIFRTSNAISFFPAFYVISV
jgi:hypothetical protein